MPLIAVLGYIRDGLLRASFVCVTNQPHSNFARFNEELVVLAVSAYGERELHVGPLL